MKYTSQDPENIRILLDDLTTIIDPKLQKQNICYVKIIPQISITSLKIVEINENSFIEYYIMTKKYTTVRTVLKKKFITEHHDYEFHGACHIKNIDVTNWVEGDKI